MISFLVLIVYSCQKEISNTNTTPQTDVYVAGVEYRGQLH